MPVISPTIVEVFHDGFLQPLSSVHNFWEKFNETNEYVCESKNGFLFWSIPFIGEIFFFSLNKVIIFMIFEILWLCWLFLEDGILDVERLSREVVNSLRESYSNFNNFHSFRNLNDILIFLQDYICKFIYISNIMSIILNKNIRFTNFSKLCGTRFYDFIFSHGFTNTIRSYRQLFVFFTRIEKNFHSGCRARFSRGYDFS